MIDVPKKEKRKTLIISILTLSLILLMIINIFSLCIKISNIKAERKTVIERLVNLEEEEQYLKLEVEKLNDPDYVARYAREKYLFSKDGEFNIRIQ